MAPNILTMGKAPAFQFYANDFLGATITWDAIACGMYIRLLCTQWVNGGIPDDQRRIAKAAGVELSELQREWHLLEPKFPICEDGLRRNPRLEAVRTRQNEVSEVRKDAADKRWNAIASAKPMQRKEKKKKKIEEEEEGEAGRRRTTSDAQTKIWPDFDDWWNMYANKTDRKKCEAKWSHLDQPTREHIMGHTKEYVTKGRGAELKWRRDPMTYLNGENWNDEALLTPRTNAAQRTIADDIAEGHRIIAQRYGMDPKGGG